MVYFPFNSDYNVTIEERKGVPLHPKGEFKMAITFTFNDIVAIIEAKNAENIKRYQDLEERIIKNWSDANEGVHPNVDRLGRLHAPYDGYEGEFGNTYAKGQFLPTPEAFDVLLGEWKNVSSTPYKAKLLVLEEDQQALKDYMSRWFDEVGFGKTWEQAGLQVGYMYLKVFESSMANAIQKAEESIKEERRLETIEHNIKNKAPVEEGRRSVKGKIVGVSKEFQNFTGYHAGGTVSTKMRVELDNGSVVRGTMPRILVENGAKEGDEISFTATFTQSKDDPTFGFFSRPVMEK